jgi:putative sigma-54 modulation protein
MQISTTARHCELDPEVRLFAHHRLEKLGRFARDITEAHLIVTAEGYRHSAEITLRLKGREMLSREESTEARSAIDLAADRLEQQLRRLKERRVSRKRIARSADGRTQPAPPLAEEPEAEFGEGALGEE